MKTRQRKGKCKDVSTEVEEKEDSLVTGGKTETVVVTTQDEEDQDEGDPQMQTVIEVRGSSSTVTMSWEKENEEEEDEDAMKTDDASDQMTESANGKHKLDSTVETSPSKKTKVINYDYCVFVGNLNKSKPIEELKISLANYFMGKSVLVQDIRLDRSRKQAFVDMASELDLNKALTLDGEKLLDQPMKIAKARAKSVDQVKKKVKPQVNVTAEDKKAARDARCLFLKNVPYKATKEDILKIFPSAIEARFPGGSENPKEGIAFVEFQNAKDAETAKQSEEVQIDGRTLIVDSVGKKSEHQPKKDNKNKSDKAAPNNILFVSKLSFKAKKHDLQQAFPQAVSIKIPLNKGKSKGHSFVEFATATDAGKALKSCQNMKICNREIKVKMCKLPGEKAPVISKTLIVTHMSEKTTAETLQSAFEGALSARIAVDKETGLSKKFGFVEFESEETSKAAKKSMEDCEIDGCKVKVAYAKSKRRGDGEACCR